MSPLLPSSCISTLPQTSPSTRGDWSSCDHSRKNLLPTPPKNCNYCTCVLLYGILLPQFFLMFHTHTHTSQSSSGLNSNTYVLRMQPLFFLNTNWKSVSNTHPTFSPLHSPFFWMQPGFPPYLMSPVMYWNVYRAKPDGMSGFDNTHFSKSFWATNPNSLRQNW